MSTKTIRLGSRQIAFGGIKAQEGQRDENSAKAQSKKTIKAKGGSYELYPWGNNNLLPNEKIALLRTNGDAQNLIQARIDFLYGGGFGFFRHVSKDGITVREPFSNNAIEEYLDAYGLGDVSSVVDEMATSLIEAGNMFVHRKMQNGLPIYRIKDPVTVRATIAAPTVKTYLISPDWRDSTLVDSKTFAIPAYLDGSANPEDTIVHLKPFQSGQPYYSVAQYWGEESCQWIEVMNYIAKAIGGSVKHNKNLAHICRIASQYFDQMASSGNESETDEPYDFAREKEKARNTFYEMVEKMMLDEEGPRIIYDECDLGTDGKLNGLIQFEEIKRSLNSKELQEAYQIALIAFANASRMLSGLAGVSDGKTLGSGSELKVSANYQQFFRTNRERALITKLFNRDVKPALKLPKDVHAGFNDILLVSDDKNPSGKEAKATGQPAQNNQDDAA